MEFLRETNIDFMKYRKFWIVVSLALVVLGIFMVFAHGRLNVGIDFAGGTQITLRFQERPDVDRLRQLVAASGVGESQIQRFGDAEANEVMIRTPLAEGTEEGSGSRVLAALRQEYGDRFQVLSQENVGPQVGAELRRKGFQAVAWSLVGMLAYIWVRFELRFGVGATMATLHDVLVTLGLFTLAGFEFNLTTIAAFLTLIGYSVNDTVVVFDRVRENMRKHPNQAFIKLLNTSINQTLSRTLLTGGTTIMAGIALMIWGGEVLRGFAFILTVGVIVGTYSSIYVASPFALLWEQIFGRRGRERQAAKDVKDTRGPKAPPASPGRPPRAASGRR
jgi:preprotein translocase subunit SecF